MSADGPVRVLIVDDSAAIRRLLRSLLETAPGYSVVGTAANGRAALDQIATLAPDVITLDIEMPILDGIGCLKELRTRWPNLPVIMLSTLTERGAASTLDALAAGASDYLTKPTNFADANLAVEAIRSQLVSKIDGLVSRTRRPTAVPAALPVNASSIARPVKAVPSGRGSGVADIVAVGVSTGGPTALAKLLSSLAKDFPVPMVIAQHIPPLFSRLLAERLNASVAMTVKEAEDGEELRPGVAYIGPGDLHITVAGNLTRRHIALNRNAPENSCRPAVDVLFRSVAQIYGSTALGVVLTGMGQDGLLGAQVLRAAGASIVVQDEATSVVWGMPGFVARAGLADEVLALDHIGPTLAARTRRGAGAGPVPKAARA